MREMHRQIPPTFFPAPDPLNIIKASTKCNLAAALASVYRDWPENGLAPKDEFHPLVTCWFVVYSVFGSAFFPLPGNASLSYFGELAKSLKNGN